MLVKLEAYRDGDFWCARGIRVSVFTQGETFDDLLENVKEALSLHFEEKLEQGETLQVLILTETEVKGKLYVHRPQGSISSVPDEEIQRRKALVKHTLKMREDLSPLGMTTTELVRLAREDRKSLYES